MPLPAPRRIDDMPQYFLTDTCDILEQCKTQYEEFRRTFREAKTSGELYRWSREDLQEMSKWSRLMREQIYTLEIAVTEMCN